MGIELLVGSQSLKFSINWQTRRILSRTNSNVIRHDSLVTILAELSLTTSRKASSFSQSQTRSPAGLSLNFASRLLLYAVVCNCQQVSSPQTLAPTGDCPTRKFIEHGYSTFLKNRSALPQTHFQLNRIPRLLIFAFSPHLQVRSILVLRSQSVHLK